MRSKLLRYGLIVGNLVVIAGVIALVAMHFKGNADAVNGSQLRAASLISQPTSKSALSNPLDQQYSADIAVYVARSANLPEQLVVTNQANSLHATQTSGAVVGTNTVSKPQIVATSNFASNKDIKTYVTKAGDTISSIATNFGITSDSVRWSNNLTGDTIAAGKAILIPPINAIVYTVKAGDTPDSLADQYKSSKDKIIAYNDAELTGLVVGQRILIPDGTKPAPALFGGGSYYYAAFGNIAGNYSLYDQWNCTWWVARRWAETGRPVMPLLGNASQWYYVARSLGMPVGTTPKQYAAAVTNPYGYGHVVFVEGVNADGSVNTSEMNVSGQNTWRPVDPTVTRRTVSAAEAARYLYIY